jgi:hypothetical protein
MIRKIGRRFSEKIMRKFKAPSCDKRAKQDHAFLKEAARRIQHARVAIWEEPT